MHDTLIWDSIQYGNFGGNVITDSSRVPLKSLQESCSTNGCMFVIKGFGSLAEKAYDNIKKKLDNKQDIH